MTAYAGLSQHIDFARLPSPGNRFELSDMIGEGLFFPLFSFFLFGIIFSADIIVLYHEFILLLTGTYGEVYSAIDKTTNKHVAIKILETITDNLEEIEEEYLVLRDLSQHPNLPSFDGIFLRRGFCIEDDQLWFVMEVCISKLSINNKTHHHLFFFFFLIDFSFVHCLFFFFFLKLLTAMHRWLCNRFGSRFTYP